MRIPGSHAGVLESLVGQVHSQDDIVLFISFYYFFFNGCIHSAWKFVSQGLNPNCRFDLCHSYSNTGFLTHCTRPGIKPTLPQRQCRILNPLHHSRNSQGNSFCWVGTHWELGPRICLKKGFILQIQGLYFFLPWLKVKDFWSCLVAPSRLGVRCYHCCGWGHCCGLGLTPRPGISACRGQGQISKGSWGS